jgi:hypothetical protein
MGSPFVAFASLRLGENSGLNEEPLSRKDAKAQPFISQRPSTNNVGALIPRLIAPITVTLRQVAWRQLSFKDHQRRAKFKRHDAAVEVEYKNRPRD